MSARVEWIAELEWANYAATHVVAQVTAGLDVTLREDIVLTASDLLPTPDANHACLLRANCAGVDRLIAEVVEHFGTVGLPATIYVSPACEPDDLADRLSEWGFVPQEAKEAWMVLDLQGLQLPPTCAGVEVVEADRTEAGTVAEVFVKAFGMPAELAPYMAQLLAPSVGLPGVHHYMARIDGQPVGTCTLLRYQTYGVLGSAGVLPARRGSRAATNLVIRAGTDAQARGIETLMLQTRAGTPLERLLRINGFVTAFTRTCYTLA